jgi:hypothetical protein
LHIQTPSAYNKNVSKKIYLTLLSITVSLLMLHTPSYAQTACTSPPTSTDGVTMAVTIPRSEVHLIWSRIKTPIDNPDANSYYLQIDNECPILIGNNTSIPPNTWTWVNYKNGSTGQKVFVPLTNGDHVLKIIKNEDGVQVDKLIITPDLTCTPTGNGDNCIQAPIQTPTPTVITPTTTQLIGDFNKDNAVDILDFNLWRNEFLGLLTTKSSDANGDGVVDLIDYNIWLNAFNN